MLFSALIVAATAFSSFALAQNTSLPIGACCTLDPNTVSNDNKSTWCAAERHTCPEVCGGIGKTKAGGNECSTTNLNFTCTCSDGTSPNMSDYQQSVPALMCREWFSRCIIASGENLDQQLLCKAVTCGNKTTEGAVSTSAAASGGASSTGGGGASATSGSPSAASSSGAATALAIAREYGTPILAGGMAAVFGLVL
ncbi:uncharacterized protein BDR25DRAFT_254995 [Lindgomyces ingoldianus]|uniref:Uncharacterized protein n=1 Tax=Lindgomyces ingoldianus TaxID=673940 RepID=A0ACB6R5V4_9PLEO|nr:uncharacterized protein BDR25DRAFT_254995 [Lindgomyces ingoldianus]KAF2474663.1 hypothetical protein BDR25DRAFT_254995 [Lindgomyces ingoldianus]